MDAWRPRNLIFHDYGGTPQNADGVFNPYHALVFPDGKIRYRDPANPYAAPAPHAYKLNPASIGLSYAGPVGSTPTPEALNALKQEYQRIKSLFPDIEALSHGEAYQRTKGTPQQASRLGRGLDEASWRTILLGTGAAPAGLTPPQPQQAPPPPVSARPAQGAPMTPQAPQSPQLPAYTGATPNDVETQRKMAQALMMQGMSTEPVGHWTQALARVLQGASGGMYQAQARKGEQQGTAELARMLGGGGTPDAGALIQNPWTRDIGTKIAVARMDPNAGKTDPIKEYEYAVKNGFKGSLQDWKISSKANQGEYNKVPIFGIGADGKPVMLQTGSRGDAVATKLPEGVSVNAQKPIEIDAGDRTILLDPITRTPIREVPKNIAEAGRQKAVGTAQGEAQVNLPTVESNAKQLLDYVDSVANDKNLDRMLGYGGYLPNVSTGARTMQSKINQLNSNAFLNAFERLKGGGAITEVEGRTATEAMTRLREMVQDGKDYREALRDFRNEVSRLLEVARRKAGAGGPSGNAGLPAQGQPAQGLAPGSYNWTPQGLQPAQ